MSVVTDERGDGQRVTLIDRAYRWFNMTWLGSGSSVGSH